MGIVAWIVLGLAAGLIANLLIPGKRSQGLILTCLIGVAGALVGGWVASRLFHIHSLQGFFNLSTWLTAIAGAAVPAVCDDGSDTTSVPIIVSSFSESWCGRKNCPFPYTSSACGSARSRARAGSPSSSRTSVRIASQSSPVSVTWSGVISQVSRTLRSISVCSPRPNRADRALAIIRLACGALTGKLIGPAPATVSLTSLAGMDSCALNAPGPASRRAP